jgi:hypothetical protein
MRVIGFSDGLATVKATAQEIVDKGIDIGEEYDPNGQQSA